MKFLKLFKEKKEEDDEISEEEINIDSLKNNEKTRPLQAPTIFQPNSRKLRSRKEGKVCPTQRFRY